MSASPSRAFVPLGHRNRVDDRVLVVASVEELDLEVTAAPPIRAPDDTQTERRAVLGPDDDVALLAIAEVDRAAVDRRRKQA